MYTETFTTPTLSLKLKSPSSHVEGGPRGPGRPWRPFCSGSHAEFGRDPRSSFPQNADLDPKIQECRPNLSIFLRPESWCAGLEIVDNMHKGGSKFVGAFRNFFLTLFRAQRSDESFQTREMTTRTSSFTLKQKHNPTSKKQLSILKKTMICRAVFGSSKSRIFRFRSSRRTNTSDISNFRERTRSMCNETHL